MPNPTIVIFKKGDAPDRYVIVPDDIAPGTYALYNPATQIVVERAKVEDARYSDEYIGNMVRAAIGDGQ